MTEMTVLIHVGVSEEVRQQSRGPRKSKSPTNSVPADQSSRLAAPPNTGMPPMPWFPAWFASSTRGWAVTAKGVFRELLDSQWELDALPEDPVAPQHLIRATATEWEYWSTHVSQKFPVEGRFRRNPALAAHRVRVLEVRERQRASARKANAARWGSPSE